MPQPPRKKQQPSSQRGTPKKSIPTKLPSDVYHGDYNVSSAERLKKLSPKALEDSTKKYDRASSDAAEKARLFDNARYAQQQDSIKALNEKKKKVSKKIADTKSRRMTP